LDRSLGLAKNFLFDLACLSDRTDQKKDQKQKKERSSTQHRRNCKRHSIPPSSASLLSSLRWRSPLAIDDSAQRDSHRAERTDTQQQQQQRQQSEQERCNGSHGFA
jgi:hypothetical protein